MLELIFFGMVIHQLIKMDPLWLCPSCNEEATFLDKPEGLLAVISSMEMSVSCRLDSYAP